MNCTRASDRPKFGCHPMVGLPMVNGQYLAWPLRVLIQTLSKRGSLALAFDNCSATLQ